MVELTDLQATIKTSGAHNDILSLIGNIFALQNQIKVHQVNKLDFTYFVTNIRKVLEQIKTTVNAETVNVETDDKKVDSQVQLILSLIQNFQTVISSGNVQNLSKEIQNILSKIIDVGTQTTNTHIVKVVTVITNTLNTVETEAKSGTLDVSNVRNILSNLLKIVNHIASNKTANTKISKIEILIRKFEQVVKSGNNTHIANVLKQVWNDSKRQNSYFK